MLIARSLPVPLIFAAASALPAESAVSSTGVPEPLSICATPSLLSTAYDISTYVIEFLVLFTPSATPADFSLPAPVPVHFLAGLPVQAPPPAAARYLVKFSVVPDSSERKNTEIGADGSVTPAFSLAIAGSFQVLMAPWKILAAVGPSRTSLATPSRL